MKQPEFYTTFVQVLNRGEATMGDRGQEEGKYEVVAKVRARVIQLKGATRIKERTMDATDKATLYLRWREGLIDSDTHFIWKGKEYRQDGPPIIDKHEHEIQTIIVSLQE